jgi:adenine deaminase
VSAISDQRRALAAVARGEDGADLVLLGGTVVEVHTGTLVEADVAIKGDRVALVGDVAAVVSRETTTLDVSGTVLAPGFFESHIHMGSSHLSPVEFAKLTIAHGTAAVGVDFKEPALVGGQLGFDTWLSEIRCTPLKLLLSGFPPLLLSDRFGEDAANALLDLPELIELREWSAKMEVGNERLANWAAAARERHVMLAGHLQGESGGNLQASVAIGVSSDHESTSALEVLEKARLGLRIIARRGGDFPELMRAVTEHGVDPRCFIFCVDDQEADLLLETGHIDGMVREAIKLGVRPLDAVRMASLNAAEHFGLAQDLGSVTPGRLAHINVLSDLHEPHVKMVIADGDLVAVDGAYVAPLEIPVRPACLFKTVTLPTLKASQFAVPAPRGSLRLRVIGLREHSVITDAILINVDCSDGLVVADPLADLTKIAMIDRLSGGSQMSIGFLRGLRLGYGAFASTFSFRDMNMMVVGVGDRDMAAAADRAKELQGGIVVVRDELVMAEFPMPLMGIASVLDFREAAQLLGDVHAAIRDKLECKKSEALMLACAATFPAAIPELKLGIYGLERTRPGAPPKPVDLVVGPDELE